MRKVVILFLVVGLAGVAGWFLWPQSTALSYQPQPLESSGTTAGTVSFTGGDGVTPVTGTVTSPGGQAVGCVLAVHGLGGTANDMAPVADTAAGKGWRTLSVDAGWGPGFENKLVAAGLGGKTPASMLEAAMVDVRRGVDWLEQYGQCDGHIVYIGASLGAMTGTAIVANEPRVDAAVLLVAGATYKAALDQAGFGQVDLSAWDPVNFIGQIAPRPVLLVNARADEVIPPDDAAQLQQAAGPSARTDWVEGGHTPDATALATMTQEAGSLLDSVVK
jgi:dienelactone hydrolase